MNDKWKTHFQSVANLSSQTYWRQDEIIFPYIYLGIKDAR